MRTKQGTITAAKMKDTVTVTVHRSVFHPKYKKNFRVSTKFLADSKGFDLAVGDEVVIAECRPLSKRKRFRVQEVTKHAARVSELVEEGELTALTKHKKPPKEEESVSVSKS